MCYYKTNKYVIKTTKTSKHALLTILCDFELYILFQKYIFVGLDIRKHSHPWCCWDLGQLAPSQSPEATLGGSRPCPGIPQQERCTVASGNTTWSDYVSIDSALLRPKLIIY